MPNSENQISIGYLPDLKNKQLASMYLRHRDGYGALDLLPETILVSARLSQVLLNLTLENDDADLQWKNVLTLIEMKRKLVDTLTKHEDLLFRQKEVERVNDYNLTKSKMLAPEIYEQAVLAVARATFEFVPENKRGEFAAKLEQLKALYAE